jgi:hypothetical protein
MAEGDCPLCGQPTAERDRKEHLTASPHHKVDPNSDIMKLCVAIMKIDERLKSLESKAKV